MSGRRRRVVLRRVPSRSDRMLQAGVLDLVARCRRAATPGALYLTSLGGAIGAVLLYVYAWVEYSGFLHASRARRADGPGAGASPAVSYHKGFPFSLVCSGDNGVPAETVPAWLNPVLIVLPVTAFVAFFLAAWRMRVRTRPDR